MNEGQVSPTINPILLLDMARIFGVIAKEETNSHHMTLAECVLFFIRNNKSEEKAERKIAEFISELDGTKRLYGIHSQYAKIFLSMSQRYNPNDPKTQSLPDLPIPDPKTSPKHFIHRERKEKLYLIGFLFNLWLAINTFLFFPILNSTVIEYLSFLGLQIGLGIAIFFGIHQIYPSQTKDFIEMLTGK